MNKKDEDFRLQDQRVSWQSRPEVRYVTAIVPAEVRREPQRNSIDSPLALSKAIRSMVGRFAKGRHTGSVKNRDDLWASPVREQCIFLRWCLQSSATEGIRARFEMCYYFVLLR